MRDKLQFKLSRTAAWMAIFSARNCRALFRHRSSPLSAPHLNPFPLGEGEQSVRGEQSKRHNCSLREQCTALNHRGNRSGRLKRSAGRMAVIAIALTAAAPQTFADLKLCNATASRVGVAIGYKNKDGWSTEGWWNVPSHTCETLLKGNLVARYYYVHAIDYDRGGEWAGKAFMCTADKAFTIRGVLDCAKRGYRRSGFFEVDTVKENNWTVRLVDPGETTAK